MAQGLTQSGTYQDSHPDPHPSNSTLEEQRHLSTPRRVTFVAIKNVVLALIKTHLYSSLDCIGSTIRQGN